MDVRFLKVPAVFLATGLCLFGGKISAAEPANQNFTVIFTKSGLNETDQSFLSGFGFLARTHGKARLTAKLADGSPLTIGGKIDANGFLKVHTRTAKGDLLAGFINFSSDAHSDCRGSLRLTRRAPHGTTGEGIGLVLSGSILTSIRANSDFFTAPSTLRLTGAKLADPLIKSVTALNGGLFQFSPAGDDHLVLTLGPRGTVSGQFVLPAKGGFCKLDGIVFEKTHSVFGFASRRTITGEFSIAPDVAAGGATGSLTKVGAGSVPIYQTGSLNIASVTPQTLNDLSGIVFNPSTLTGSPVIGSGLTGGTLALGSELQFGSGGSAPTQSGNFASGTLQLAPAPILNSLGLNLIQNVAPVIEPQVFNISPSDFVPPQTFVSPSIGSVSGGSVSIGAAQWSSASVYNVAGAGALDLGSWTQTKVSTNAISGATTLNSSYLKSGTIPSGGTLTIAASVVANSSLASLYEGNIVLTKVDSSLAGSDRTVTGSYGTFALTVPDSDVIPMEDLAEFLSEHVFSHSAE